MSGVVDATPMRMRRGLVACACFAMGLVVAREAEIPALAWVAAVCGACAVAVAGRGRVCIAALAVAAIGLGGAAMTLRVLDPMRATARLAAQGARMADLRGVVTEVLPGVAPGGGRRCVLRVIEASTDAGVVGVRGLVRVSVSAGGDVESASPAGGEGGGGHRLLAIGSAVRMRGVFVPVEGPANPGERDDRPWAAQEGRIGRLAVASEGLVWAWTPPEMGLLGRMEAGWRRGLAWLRGRAGGVLDRAVAAGVEEEWPEGAGGAGGGGGGGGERASEGEALLGALLLGRNDPALRPLTEAMSRLGQVHVLSISGFHLALMSVMALWVIRLTGDRGRVEPALVAGLVVGYLLIVPAQAPVLRSGFMVLALLAGEAAGRRYDGLNILGLVAVGLLAWRPMDLWSPGFQLSFGVTGVLIWLGSRFRERLFPEGVVGTAAEAQRRRDPGERGLWGWASEQVKGLVSASVLCWAVATPVVMYHVGIVSPLAALTSVVLVPVYSVLLWAGFAAMALGAASPIAGELAGGVLVRMADATAWLTHALDGLPWMAVSMPAVPVWWTVLATVVVIWWCRSGSWRSGRDWALACAALGSLAWMLAGSGRLGEGAAARADALAVGDGTAVLIRSGSQGLLWGGLARDPERVARVVPRAARDLGAWRVRTMVLATPNPASAMGLAEAGFALGVADALVPAEWVSLAAEQATSEAGRLLARLRERGVRVRAVEPGAELRFGQAVLVLDRPAGALPGVWVGELRAAEGVGGGAGARALLVESLPRSVLEREIDGGRWSEGAAVVSLPGVGHAGTWERVEQWCIRTGPVAVFRSEAPRLGVPWRDAARSRAAGVYATGMDGAVWIEWGLDGRVRHGAWRE